MHDGEYDWAIVARIDGKKHIIAEVFGRVAKDVRPDAEGIAEFIVRACNSHKSLIKQLEDTARQLQMMAAVHIPENMPRIKLRLRQQINSAKAALAEAKGE